MDFRRVTGLDSSAVISFVKGKQLATAQRITLLLTSVSPSIQRQFELTDLVKDDDEVMRILPDLDRGLEWCEEQLLGTELVTKVIIPPELSAQLAQSGFERAKTARLMRFLERIQVQLGEYLIRQGDEAGDLYFIEQGGVSVYLELDDGQQIRLQTLSLGTIVGELGLYLGTARTASVVADSPTVAYRLTREALAEMREQEPELAALFNEFLVRLLSERLASTNELVKAILR
jgi:SulP family sulfate permease